MEHIVDLGELLPGLVLVDGKAVDVVSKIVISTDARCQLCVSWYANSVALGNAQIISLLQGDTLTIKGTVEK